MWRSCQHRYALAPISRSLTSCCRGQRRFLSAPSKPYDAAVIGGGITGLTTAFRLSRDPNCTKVTLYEQSNQLGGWLQSETIEVDGGEVVFEYGPRTLRSVSPASLPMIDLVRLTREITSACDCKRDSDAFYHSFSSSNWRVRSSLRAKLHQPRATATSTILITSCACQRGSLTPEPSPTLYKMERPF